MLEEMTALSYHQAVAAWLEQAEPGGWAAVRAQAGDPGTDYSSSLLRTAYRLEPAGHPAVHDALARAAENLGVRTPVAIYQLEQGAESNAGLLELPGELAVLLSGNLLSLLPSGAGLAAVFGHELAHHVLDSLDQGRYRVAGRLLEVLVVDAGTPQPYLETARRYRLATELFCDRGSVKATGGDLHAAVAALVTVATGLAGVDPAGYLAQAEAADPLGGSRAGSHPETALRAWALGRWQAELEASPAVGGETDRPAPGARAARALLRPGLDLDQLDVFDRADLEHLTRTLISGLLLAPEWHTEAVVAQAHQYFPGLPVAEPGAPSEWGSPSAVDVTPLPEDLSAASRRYLAYVLLDLVAADPDLDLERSVAAAGAFAARVGLAKPFRAVAQAELQLSTAAWKRLESPAGAPAR